MKTTDKSKKEIMQSDDMEEVLDWYKVHPQQGNTDVFDHFLELARKQLRPYDPDVFYDPDPQKL